MLDRLQKADQETIEFIKLIKQTLFSLGIRTSEERAWEVFKSLNKLPFQGRRYKVSRTRSSPFI